MGIDGPLPFGDAVGVPLLIAAGAWALGEAVVDFWDNDSACESCPLIDIPPFPRVLPLPPPIVRFDGDVDCAQAKAECLQRCSDEVLPTGTLDGAPFFRCVRECMESFGC